MYCNLDMIVIYICCYIRSLVLLNRIISRSLLTYVRA
jgi:hypothetical protein